MSVSVVIPYYNAESTIKRAVRSVLRQSCPADEIIIVNDGSPGQKPEHIIDLFDDSRQTTVQIVSQSNRGPSAARNNGIIHARGDYVAFLDADDYWDEGKLEAQLHIFETDPTVKLVGCLTNVDRTRPCAPVVKTISLERLRLKNYFKTSTVIVARSVLEKEMFDESRKYSEDYDLWLRICAFSKCQLLTQVLSNQDDKPLYGYSGLSAKLWKMEKGEVANYFGMLQRSDIGHIAFIFTVAYSMTKFIIRAVTVALRNMFRRRL